MDETTQNFLLTIQENQLYISKTLETLYNLAIDTHNHIIDIERRLNEIAAKLVTANL